jgi:hypothetical protein
MINAYALLGILEDQISLGFSGRLHLLSEQKQQLGIILIKDGEMISAEYVGLVGVKAFYSLIIDCEFERKINTILEPEIVKAYQRNIHFPLSLLKKRVLQLVEIYKVTRAKKAPDDIMVELVPEAIFQDVDITGEEFDLMLTLCHYKLIKDVYDHCPLLDFEITNALVSLRNKKALKVIGKVIGD